MEREATLPGQAEPSPPRYIEADPVIPVKAGYVDPAQSGQPNYPPPGYMQQQQQQQQHGYSQQQQQPIFTTPASSQQYPPPGQPQPVYNQQPQAAPINIVVNSSNVTEQHQQQQQQQGGGSGVYIPKPANYLGLAIWVLICWNWPLGIAAIVFSCLSTTAFDEGDIEAARTRGRISLYISISGILSAILIIIIMIASLAAR